MSFANSWGNWARFDLQGTDQTLAGLNTGGVARGAVIQNERLGGGGTSADGTLTLDVAGGDAYSYYGYLRDEDDGGNTYKLNLVKDGDGTQTLIGDRIYYTGTTTTPPPEAPAFKVRSVHSLPGGNGEEVFDFVEAESSGTQRLVALLGPWFGAVESVGLLVVDELDCSMHPALTRKLLQFFQDSRENRTGAQLVFATHDTSLMDQSLFRRDQIWLVEKDATEASRLFSLYDFKEKPRMGEALEKRYLAGRYGGVPQLGQNFQDIGVD